MRWLCPAECAAFSGCEAHVDETRYALAPDSSAGRQAWQGKTDTGRPRLTEARLKTRRQDMSVVDKIKSETSNGNLIANLASKQKEGSLAAEDDAMHKATPPN